MKTSYRNKSVLLGLNVCSGSPAPVAVCSSGKVVLLPPRFPGDDGEQTVCLILRASRSTSFASLDTSRTSPLDGARSSSRRIAHEDVKSTEGQVAGTGFPATCDGQTQRAAPVPTCGKEGRHATFCGFPDAFTSQTSQATLSVVLASVLDIQSLRGHGIQFPTLQVVHGIRLTTHYRFYIMD